MDYLRVCLLILLVCLVGAHASEMPTFQGLCQLQGDWCTTNCQIAGGRDGLCNKVGLCICRPL
uniref:Uncharacterized protein, isoform B n=1 Tax=Drosophila melanogaster TaxID=7227 RepID=A0A0B4LET5_DROME|nr:uncharacterized protein Dmel_CG43114, isoform B [Drosophila melanogaster]AHN56111.1 uncharacterized protein Dmel_CG43114, isoform B [Drosophila melanogaster]|eukprot:NP_001286313.1 uncharacterized protein Dmel_CG43114, isoform B [Drosophila melanogaster]